MCVCVGGVYRGCSLCNLPSDTVQMGKSANQQQLVMNAAPAELNTRCLQVRLVT